MNQDETSDACREPSGRRLQVTALLLLRMAVGWHLLYEGLAKAFTPGWTSKGYLLSSDWIFAGLFKAMANSTRLLPMVDVINIAVLILAGVSLILGIYARAGSMAGAFLILLYYLAHPPFTGMAQFMPHEGSYLVIDKNAVEFFALIVLAAFPASAIPGVDRLRAYVRSGRPYSHPFHPQPDTAAASPAGGIPAIGRRELLRNLVTLPVVGGFALAFLNKQGWFSHEEAALKKIDAISGASRKDFAFAGLDNLKGKLPRGKIGGVGISRLIFGGNLINGTAHARDLIYVSSLVKSYFTEERIMQSWQLAEQCGINTMTFWPNRNLKILKEYRRRGGQIQWLGHVGISEGNDRFRGLKTCIDNGAVGIYIAGDICERYVFAGRVNELAEAIDFIKSNRLFAGIACHAIKVPIACEQAGMKADFYMKTLHRDNYWSATPKEKRTADVRFGDPSFDGRMTSGVYHDNIWCVDAEETIAFMAGLHKPWIGFKVLAAGALEPADGFKYAFENGADFLHVGMFDFQTVTNTNICSEILAGKLTRARAWCDS